MTDYKSCKQKGTVAAKTGHEEAAVFVHVNPHTVAAKEADGTHCCPTFQRL